MGVFPTLPVDGNGRPLTNVGITPGVGYAMPQMGTQTADATTGQNVAPQVMSLASSANNGLPVGLPAIVQKAVGVSTGSVALLAQAFINPNIAGNSIVVVAACGNGTAMTVADSLGNTYTQAITAPNSTTFETAIFFAVGILGGANIVTVTNAGASASMGVEIYEVSGLIAQVLAQPGQTSSGTGTGTTASTSPIAPSVPNALVFAGVAIGTGVVTAFAAGTGLVYDSSTQQPATPSGLFQFASLSGFLGNIGGISPSATWTTSRAWAMAAVIFKPVTLGIEGTVRIGGYNVTYITTAVSGLLIKTGPGVLRAINVNTKVASGTIEWDDALTHTNPKGIITFPATLLSDGPIPIPYDAQFNTGLCMTTTGTMDITVVWK